MEINIAVLTALAVFAIPISDTASIDWAEETPYVSMSGCAAYYSEGLMEINAQYWGYIKDTKDYDSWLESSGYLGAVAVYRNGDKGKEVHILWPDGTLDGPYIAIEVVARTHYELGIERNRVVDVDYNTAKRVDMRGPMNVTIIYDLNSYLSISITRAYLPFTKDKYSGCMGK